MTSPQQKGDKAITFPLLTEVKAITVGPVTRAHKFEPLRHLSSHKGLHVKRKFLLIYRPWEAHVVSAAAKEFLHFRDFTGHRGRWNTVQELLPEGFGMELWHVHHLIKNHSDEEFGALVAYPNRNFIPRSDGNVIKLCYGRHGGLILSATPVEDITLEAGDRIFFRAA